LLLTWAIAMPAITDDKKPDTLKKDDGFVPGSRARAEPETLARSSYICPQAIIW
jgi:hypothetical protein